MDFNRLALADILNHPRLGVVSFQGDVGDIMGDRIYVRDDNFILHEALASECDLPSDEEHSAYWKRVNKKKEKGEREMEKDFNYSVYSGEKEEERGMKEEEPKGQESPGMDLLRALSAVFGGRKVHRLAWLDKNVYVAMISNQLCIRKPDGAHAWLISADDVEAEDWEIWSPPRLARLQKEVEEKVSRSPTTVGEPSA